MVVSQKAFALFSCILNYNVILRLMNSTYRLFGMLLIKKLTVCTWRQFSPRQYPLDKMMMLAASILPVLPLLMSSNSVAFILFLLVPHYISTRYTIQDFHLAFPIDRPVSNQLVFLSHFHNDFSCWSSTLGTQHIIIIRKQGVYCW